MLNAVRHRSSALWTRIGLLWALLLGAALRFYQLDADSLWVDEVITQTLAQKPVAEMLRIISQYSAHPPLAYLIPYQARVMGFSDFAARIPSVFAGLLTIPLVYALGRRWWGARAGISASLLAACWPVLLQYAQEARPYALLVCFVALSTYGLYRALETGGARWWSLFVFGTTGALYTHYFGFLWLAIAGVFVLVLILVEGVRAGSRRAWPRVLAQKAWPFAASVGLCAIAYLPWYRGLWAQAQRLVGSGGESATAQASLLPLSQILRDTVRLFSQNESALTYAGGVLLLLGVIYAGWQRNWRPLTLALLSLVFPMVLLSLIPVQHFFHPRYLLPVLIPAILLAAHGLSALVGFVPGRFRRQVAEWATRALWFLLPLALLSFAGDFYRERKEDWRGAAQYLATHRQPQDVIIGDGFVFGQGGDAERVQQGIGYYLANPDIVMRADAGVIERLPDPDQAGTAWGVLWYQRSLADRGALADDYTFTDFYQVLVIGLTRPSGDILRDMAAILEAMRRLQPRAETYADLHFALAGVYSAMGESDLAAHQLTQAGTEPPASLLSAVERLRIQQAGRTDDLAAARVAYRDLLASELTPEMRFDALMAWASLERAKANPDQAIPLFEQALALQFDHVEAHANYGAVLLDAKQPEAAIREFEWVIAHAPTHFWAHYLGGLAYQQVGRQDAALAAFRKALTLATDQQMQQLAAPAAFAAALRVKDCVTAQELLDQNTQAFAGPDEARQQLLATCP